MVERDGIRYTLNGVELDTENTVVMLGSTYLAGIETTRTVVEVPGMHGTVPACQLPLFKERQVTVRFGVAGAYHAQTALLARLCSMPNLTLGRTIDGIRQEAAVELVSLQADGDEVVGRYASYTAVFAMPGVWWRDPDAMTMQIPLSGGALFPPVGPAITNGKGYWTRALGEPDNSPSVLANFVTMPLGPEDASPSLLYTGIPEGYFGDAPIPDAIIRLPANVTSATILDVQSGTGVIWHGDASSQYTYINAANLTAWRSASASAWARGTAIGGVDYPAAGPLQVNPSPDGGYALDAAVSGASDGSICVRLNRSWW